MSGLPRSFRPERAGGHREPFPDRLPSSATRTTIGSNLRESHALKNCALMKSKGASLQAFGQEHAEGYRAQSVAKGQGERPAPSPGVQREEPPLAFPLRVPVHRVASDEKPCMAAIQTPLPDQGSDRQTEVVTSGTPELLGERGCDDDHPACCQMSLHQRYVLRSQAAHCGYSELRGELIAFLAHRSGLPWHTVLRQGVEHLRRVTQLERSLKSGC